MEYRVPTSSGQTSSPEAELKQPSVDVAKVRAFKNRWQEKLIDLAGSNPLLDLPRSRISKLQVTKPGLEELFDSVSDSCVSLPHVRKKPPKDRTLFDGQVNQEGEEPEWIVDEGDVELAGEPEELFRKIRRIHDNARLTLEERGITTLYLTFGALRWKDERMGDCLSPLLLLPCQFEPFDSDKPPRLEQADQEVRLNPALLYYLRGQRGVELPEPPEQLTGASLMAFLDQVAGMVGDRDWQVQAQSWLATFTYSSLQLYEDLKSTPDEVLANHEVIQAFARAATPPEASEALGEERLDQLKPADEAPIPLLEADSSQLKALTLARRGGHLVIHGPPGTGKSQTIANLIADALGQGRTVLFVSAKMAALNVVHERLSRLGLDRFTLEAHSTKAGKAQIVDELRRTLEAQPAAVGPEFQEKLDHLGRLRGELNEYVRELHIHRGALGLSIYGALGRLERLREAPSIKSELPWTPIQDVSPSQLQVAVDGLSELGSIAEIYDQRDRHPWRGYSGLSAGDLAWEELEPPVQQLKSFAAELLPHLKVLEPVLGDGLSRLPLLKLIAFATCLQSLGRTRGLPPNWHQLPLDRIRDARRLSSRALEQTDSLRGSRQECAEALPIPTSEALELLAPLETRFTSWARLFKPSYWAWRKRVRSKWAISGSFSRGACIRLLTKLREVLELERELQQSGDKIREVYPFEGSPGRKDLETIVETLKTVAMIRMALSDSPVRLPGAPSPWSDHMRRCAERAGAILADPKLTKALDAIENSWVQGFEPPSPVRSMTLEHLVRRVEELQSASSRSQEWVTLRTHLARLHELGLRPFLEALGTTSARLAPKAFLRRFYVLWANRIIQQSPPLSGFMGLTHSQRIQRFRELDRELQEKALHNTKAKASQNARMIREHQGGVGVPGEVGILQRELQKKRRIKPLRKLFAEIPRALLALKPCMLMSPLSVATFLQRDKFRFDLVVFDEASQLPTPEAVPAILRGKQIVVAGDENQLPPSSFFRGNAVVEEDEDDENAPEPLESLLNDAVAVEPAFQRCHLRWHYRSRDERLIGFSNHFFYDNGLITFPSRDASADDVGVQLEFVPEGVWDRGRSKTNRIEAQRVVNVIIDHLERLPERSLGVVALNIAQSELIRDLLDQALANRPDLASLLSEDRQEPFFIKSLENVQGDERDTIVISIGYAKAADGGISYNFGPLNREGGWRRLNVLVTRAKWQTILVTSFKSKDLDGVNPGNRGACALRDFIAYAERRGKLPPATATLSGVETNDFEDSVAEALRERGYAVDAQVGVSSYRIDLAVRHPQAPNRYAIGIECDGATYHSAKTARDRDLLRQTVLEGHGWRFYRVWSTDWFKNRQGAMDLLLKAVEAAIQSPMDVAVIAPPVAKPPEHAVIPEPVQHAPVDRKYPAGIPYRKYRPQSVLSRYALLNERATRELTPHIIQVVEEEAPIHEQVLADRLMEISGVGRMGHRVEKNILLALERAKKTGGIEARGPFLHSRKQGILAFRMPGDDFRRPLEHIAPEEIQRAILHIAEAAFGCSRESLVKPVCDLFGSERPRQDTCDIVLREIEALVGAGQLKSDGTSVTI